MYTHEPYNVAEKGCASGLQRGYNVTPAERKMYEKKPTRDLLVSLKSQQINAEKAIRLFYEQNTQQITASDVVDMDIIRHERNVALEAACRAYDRAFYLYKMTNEEFARWQHENNIEVMQVDTDKVLAESLHDAFSPTADEVRKKLAAASLQRPVGEKKEHSNL